MVQPIQLVTSGGQIVVAHIVSMAESHVNDVQDFWRPILIEANQPDAGWIWDYKLRQSQQDDRYEAYSLDVDGLSQGLIFMETQWHRSPLSGRSPLVYVEAISSAPWNRVDIEQPPWFRGVGRRLLTFARLRSVELGYGGRVGLHSLPSAEGFYQQLKMTDYGPDPEKDGLIYFEYGVI